MVLTFTLKSQIATLTSASGFDKHFWLQFVLLASTLGLVLEKHFGGLAQFGLLPSR